MTSGCFSFQLHKNPEAKNFEASQLAQHEGEKLCEQTPLNISKIASPEHINIWVYRCKLSRGILMKQLMVIVSGECHWGSCVRGSLFLCLLCPVILLVSFTLIHVIFMMIENLWLIWRDANYFLNSLTMKSFLQPELTSLDIVLILWLRIAELRS